MKIRHFECPDCKCWGISRIEISVPKTLPASAVRTGFQYFFLPTAVGRKKLELTLFGYEAIKKLHGLIQ
ncbi:MAG: hypothetical protein CMH48_10390 [Muricauda sp.]|nr:hypothetical protein [Allomuricauda sp.]MBC31242.1 hypothetical protein [Allomuricauda sp.]